MDPGIAFICIYSHEHVNFVCLSSEDYCMPVRRWGSQDFHLLTIEKSGLIYNECEKDPFIVYAHNRIPHTLRNGQ